MNSYQSKVDRFKAIMSQITMERSRQDAKWGEQNHDFPKYYQILNEELGESSKAFLEKDVVNLRVELIQSAAVLVAMLECGDRTGWFVNERRVGPKNRRENYGRRTCNIGNIDGERRIRERGNFVGRRGLVEDRRKS